MAIKRDVYITGYAALRSDLIHLADEENKLRLELVRVQELKAPLISALIEKADKLLTRALDERDPDGALKKEFQPETNVQAVVDYVHPGRRNCGLCGKPGHRAPTCPDAHKARAADMKEKETPKPPKKEAGKRYCSNCGFPGHRAKNCSVTSLKAQDKRGKK